MILGGDFGTLTSVIFKDSTGTRHTYTGSRNSDVYMMDGLYSMSDTLAGIKWKKLACNVGYVNLTNIDYPDIDTLYANLQNTSTIIFDNRDLGSLYQNGMMAYELANIMAPDTVTFVRFLLPDIHYPGTFYRTSDQVGTFGNGEGYQGRIIILCNEYTQSSMEHACMELQALPRATVIGVQTAGANGNVSIFHLSSDFQAGYTSLGVYYPDWTIMQRNGIRIDSLVKRTASAIRQGRDEIMEKALQTAGCLVPFLLVAPGNITVPSSAGKGYFLITCNTNWSAVSDAEWCRVSPGGSGNDTIFADYDQNPLHNERTAHITITASGLPPVSVTLIQEKSLIGLNEHQPPSFSIFPNPASGSITITFARPDDPWHEIVVSDITGRTVLSQKYQRERRTDICISELGPGCYSVGVKTINSIEVQKLIIVR
jgi:hypothetical protein